MSLIVRLPWPDKALWPNGRPPHWSVKARAVKQARSEAWAATLACSYAEHFALRSQACLLPVRVTVLPKSKGPLPDADNCVAALKASFDGIAQALRINDRMFSAPTVEFGPREGAIIIEIGGAE